MVNKLGKIIEEKLFNDLEKVVGDTRALNEKRTKGVWENVGSMVVSNTKKLDGAAVINASNIIAEAHSGHTNNDQAIKDNMNFIAKAPTNAEALILCFGLLKIYKSYFHKVTEIMEQNGIKAEIEISPEEIERVFH